MVATQLINRTIIRLNPRETNEDVAGFLQGLVTNDVSGELPTYAALLSAQGKMMFDFFVWRDGDDLLLDCELEHADDLAKRLSLYRLRRPIDIARDDTLAIHWSLEPDKDARSDPRLPALGNRWLAAKDAGARAADEAYQAHRLGLGVPEGKAELGDTLWLETNAVELNGVSFEKGCYIGQENTARMNWRQKVNRRLFVVPLDQSDEKRRKIAYPELGLAVDHLRVADIDPAPLPEWQKAALKDRAN